MKDWDLLRVLLAIQRHGGLSGAARVLGVTHATVSRKLARAEAALGVKLFDRSQDGLTATSAGAAAVTHAEAVEAAVLALDISLAPAEEGPLSITAPPLLLASHLAQDLTDFAATHPKISLSLLSENRVFNLHRREADLAIRVSNTPAESLWGRKLTAQRSGYFAAPKLIAADPAGLTQGGPLISFSGWRSPIPKQLADLPAMRVAAICDDLFAGLELVKAGLGFTRMPLAIGRADPGLRQITAFPVVDYAPIWMLTHPDLRRSPKIRAAMAFLAKRFQMHAETYV